MLMAFAAGANAECVPNAFPYSAKAYCIHDTSASSIYVNRPNNPAVKTANELRPPDGRSEMARVLAAGGLADPRATAAESQVARSITELPWADSHNWIQNPPEWVRDIKESRRRGAPVPLLHLWHSQETQTLLAVGVSRRGIPGLYISRKLP